jgi:hypothetical protein
VYLCTVCNIVVSVSCTVTKAYVTILFVGCVELGACLPDIILVIRSRTVSWAGYVARMGGTREVRTEFCCRCEDNIEMDIQ